MLRYSLAAGLVVSSTSCATLCPEIALAPSPAAATSASRRCLKSNVPIAQDTLEQRLAENRSERVRDAASDIVLRFFPDDQTLLELPNTRAGLRLAIGRLEDAAVGAAATGDPDRAAAIRGRAARLRKLDALINSTEGMP